MTVDYSTAVSNDENRDAFYKFHEFTVTGAQTEIIELRRPFAQLNIGTGDLKASKNAGYEPKYSFVKVSNVYNTLDLVEGKVSGATEVVYSYNAIPTAETFPVEGYDYLAMNYLLVASDKEVVDVEFGYTELDAATAQTRTVGSVPVQRNHRTNIYGQLLTGDVEINVEIKPEYEEPANDASLQYAAKNGGVVKLTQDVVLEKPIQVAAGKVVVIDLNGYTISGTDENKSGNYYLIDNRGTLTIQDNSSAKTGAITLEATTNRNWSNSSVVVANNPGGKLIIDGGRLEHFGGSDMAYAVDNLTNVKGTYVETIINGGTIKSTYRAVRQFLNGTEAENILTVNGGIIEGANKSIWVQDASKNANSGKLIVEGGELKGDVYLYATEGSIEWPVEVKIKQTALYGESSVLSETINGLGYFVNPSGEYYIVEKASNFAVATSADELTDAIANATEDITIILGNDIVGNATALQKENVKVTIIGNDKKFNGVILVDGKSARYSTTGLTISNINFEGDDNNISADIDAYVRLGNGNDATRYTNNVTVNNCTFTNNTDHDMVAVKSYTGGDWNLHVVGCTVNAGMHSLLQVANVEQGLKVENCKVYSENGINLNSTPTLEMDGCTFDVKGYAVRVGVKCSDNTEAKTFTISNSNLKSACAEDDDAVIVIRQNATYATLDLTGTTLAGTRDILGAEEGTTTIIR